jgi:hypothetical protein
MKTIEEVTLFFTEAFGAESGKEFSDNLENYVYFVKTSALSNPTANNTWIKSKLRKYVSNIIMSSIKTFLAEKYSDPNGDVRVAVGYGNVYDENMKPIEAINKLKKEQKGMVKIMMSFGMGEFEKGRDLALSMIERANIKDDPMHANTSPVDNFEPSLKEVQKAISALEKKLPKITKKEATELLDLYAYVRSYSLDK